MLQQCEGLITQHGGSGRNQARACQFPRTLVQLGTAASRDKGAHNNNKNLVKELRIQKIQSQARSLLAKRTPASLPFPSLWRKSTPQCLNQVARSGRAMHAHFHKAVSLQRAYSQSPLIGRIPLPLQNYTLLPLRNSARASATRDTVCHYPFETQILRAITPSKLKIFMLPG